MIDLNDDSAEEQYDIQSTDKQIKIMKSAPFWKQLALMLKITFIQRFRSSTIILEMVPPVIFLIFNCIFASRVKTKTDSLQHPQVDPIIPFSFVLGTIPNFGMIPNNNETREFIDILNEKSISPIKGNSIFFDTFTEYKEFIFKNREVNDLFYCTEWKNDSDNQKNSIRISSNGMTVGSLPYLVQNLGSTIVNITKDMIYNNPIISINYKQFPHSSMFKADHNNALYVALFSTFPHVPCILTTGIYYGKEAENGIRDFFTFFGLSFLVNELRWYIISVTLLFIISIPYAISLAALININFGLLTIFYLLVSTAYSSFLLFMMSIWPTTKMANIAGFGILLTLFIFIFWGYFDFLFKDSGFIEKYTFSILPNVALSYAMAQMASGEVTKFSQINGPSCYPVKNGMIYLTCESVVYFTLYILIEALKKRLWLPAPIKWGKPLDFNRINNRDEENTIIIENVSKAYSKTIALDNISFKVNENEKIAIVGPNGAGKSTLMSLLSGTSNFENGKILFKGIDIIKNTRLIHQIIGFCPQSNLFMDELTLDEWMKTICCLRNESNFDYEDILISLGLDQQRNCRIGKMSGGNKRKTCLAAALVCYPPIIILDEATSGVDFTSRTRIWSIISSLKNTTVIMATHTLEECEKIADKIMVLNSGKIVYYNTPNELRQIFECGYVIISNEENNHELEKIEREFELNRSIIIEDGKAKLFISYDDSIMLSQILKQMNFQYILSIQSLEEMIFNNILENELNHYQELENYKTDNSLNSILGNELQPEV